PSLHRLDRSRPQRRPRTPATPSESGRSAIGRARPRARLGPSMNAPATDLLSRHVDELCRRAVPAARSLAETSGDPRRAALHAAAEAILAAGPAIVAANAEDLARAREAGLAAAMVDRLRLDGGRLDAVCADLRAVADLPDPVGRILEARPIAQGVRM